jgi:hypothetical protein
MLDQVGELGIHAQSNIHMMERVKVPFRHRLGIEPMIWKVARRKLPRRPVTVTEEEARRKVFEAQVAKATGRT